MNNITINSVINCIKVSNEYVNGDENFLDDESIEKLIKELVKLRAELHTRPERNKSLKHISEAIQQHIEQFGAFSISFEDCDVSISQEEGVSLGECSNGDYYLYINKEMGLEHY